MVLQGEKYDSSGGKILLLLQPQLRCYHQKNRPVLLPASTWCTIASASAEQYCSTKIVLQLDGGGGGSQHCLAGAV